MADTPRVGRESGTRSSLVTSSDCTVTRTILDCLDDVLDRLRCWWASDTSRVDVTLTCPPVSASARGGSASPARRSRIRSWEINSPYRTSERLADQQAKDLAVVNVSSTVWPASGYHNRPRHAAAAGFHERFRRGARSESKRFTRQSCRNQYCLVGPRRIRDSDCRIAKFQLRAWSSPRTLYGSTEEGVLGDHRPIMPYSSLANRLPPRRRHGGATGRPEPPGHVRLIPTAVAGAAGRHPRQGVLEHRRRGNPNSSAARRGVGGRLAGDVLFATSRRPPAAGRAGPDRWCEHVARCWRSKTPRPHRTRGRDRLGSAATRRTPGPHRRAATLQHVVLAVAQASHRLKSGARVHQGTVEVFSDKRSGASSKRSGAKCFAFRRRHRSVIVHH